jgi:hypothetical protein
MGGETRHTPTRARREHRGVVLEKEAASLAFCAVCSMFDLPGVSLGEILPIVGRCQGTRHKLRSCDLIL